MPRPPAPRRLRRLRLPAGVLAGVVGAALVLSTAANRPGPARLLSATAPAGRMAPEVRVGIVAGASLLGRPTSLLLRLSVARPAGAVAVTDLVPPGLTYVAGSSALLLTNGRHRALVDPRAVPSKAGTLLVWSSLRVPASSSLVLQVAASATRAGTPAAAAALTVGSDWNDRATVYAARAGSLAPALTAAGVPPAGATDLDATALHRSEVVAVAAVQTGLLLRPAPAHAAQRLSERLTITSTSRAAVSNVTVRVYVPGDATWAGCLSPTGCARPTVTEHQLPVTSGQPDRPVLQAPAATTTTTTAPAATTTTTTAPAATTTTALASTTTAAPAATTTTTTAPAATTTAATTTAATTMAATTTTTSPTSAASTEIVSTTVPAVKAVVTAPALFTVLTWSFATLPRDTTRVITYRLAAGPIARARTEDVVTATAALPVTATAASAVVASGAVERATTARPVAPHPVVVPPVALPVEVQATAVQAWPTAAAEAASTLAGALPISSAASTTTTSTTVGSSTRDPFATTSTTQSGGHSSTTTTTVPRTTTTTKGATGKLATTGSDIFGTGEVGVALIATGGLLLLSGRRRRRPALAPSAGTPSGHDG